MIDWSKERTTKNYCGYCTNTPSGGSCTGHCFTPAHSNSKENMVDHVLTMLQEIPIQIEELKKREQYYKNSLIIK